MPANLPPQYYTLDREFKKERDPFERLRMARELLRIMPKHKGTDKLQAEMKAKIALLKKETESGGTKKHGARKVDPYSHFDNEGAGQIVLIGPPNSGKSSILDTMTNCNPAIGDYPYTTRFPMAGMTMYQSVPLQLIDTPPISEETFENYIPNLIRQADISVIVVDVATAGFEERLKAFYARLDEKRIVLCPEIPDEIEDARYCYKKAIIAAHKYLDENGEEGLARLKEQFKEFVVVPTSILEDETMDNLKKAIYKMLGIMKVFTKKVGHDPDFNDPVILPIGGTVEDAAYELHKDFAQKLQFAKLWGEGRFEGQKVKSNYILADGDIIEFHI
ncbi:MAG: TGS domain-containing protein [candidate division Zixibacteria bacterium]|nr:TGS domain-containing protein [candidate division Zixibacteria bacterium]